MSNLFGIITLLCTLICFVTWSVVAVPINELQLSSSAGNSETNGDILSNNNDDNNKKIDADERNEELMRNKRDLHNRDKLFIRFGRDSSVGSGGGNGYERKSDKNFIRFGRNNEPMKNNGFIRFGRSDKSFIRLGRDDHSDPVRFGRRGDKFIRFGRSNGGNYLNDDINGVVSSSSSSSSNQNNNFPQENGIDFDSFLDNNFKSSLLSSALSSSSALPLRTIRNQNFIRLGRPSEHNSFIRLGKKNSILFDNNNDKIDDDLNDSITNELLGPSESIDSVAAVATSSDNSVNNNNNNNANNKNNNNQRLTSPVEKLLVSIGSSGDKDSTNYEENHQKLLKLFDPADYL